MKMNWETPPPSVWGTEPIVRVISTQEGDALDISVRIAKDDLPYAKEFSTLRAVLTDCLKTYSPDGQSATVYLLVTCNLKSLTCPPR